MNGVTACAVIHLTGDAELKYTAQGVPLLSFRGAVQDSKAGPDAETTWLSVTAWNEKAEELSQEGKLVKGATVYVEGRLKLATWNGPDGQPRSGLNLNAWRVEALGQIGRRGPQRQRDRVDRSAQQRYASAGVS